MSYYSVVNDQPCKGTWSFRLETVWLLCQCFRIWFTDPSLGSKWYVIPNPAKLPASGCFGARGILKELQFTHKAKGRSGFILLFLRSVMFTSERAALFVLTGRSRKVQITRGVDGIALARIQVHVVHDHAL